MEPNPEQQMPSKLAAHERGRNIPTMTFNVSSPNLDNYQPQNTFNLSRKS
jgi:hypothetical protein